MNNETDTFERPKLEPKGKQYRLVEDWHTDCKGVLSRKATIPEGFVTDGASIPRALWVICGSPMDNPRIYAAIVHDYLYSTGGELTYSDSDEIEKLTRKDADRIYRDYQISLGSAKIKAYTEYYALRAFGSSHWNDK